MPTPLNRAWLRLAVVPCLRKGAAGIALIALLFVADVAVTHQVFTSKHPGANDFYSRWRAAQAYWLEGADPYSDGVTLLIQQGIYGRPARPDEDPGPFAYPFYTVFLLYPLVHLSYAWVEAIWLVILQFSLVGGVLLTLALYGWRPPPWMAAVSALWAVVFYHSGRTILLGQFAGLVFLWTVALLFALKLRWDIAAGILLALTTIKPQMSVLLIPALLLWGIGQRRWWFLLSAAAAMTVVVGASFALLPGWLNEFAAQLGRYPSYTAIGSPVWIITQYYLPWLGAPFEVGMTALLVLYLLFEWRRLPGSAAASASFHWLIGLTIIVTNLVVLRTATTNYVALYIPLFLALKAALHPVQRGNLLFACFCLLSTVAIWVLFTSTVVGKFEHPIVYLPLPMGLFIGFAAARKAIETALPGAHRAIARA